MKEKCAMLYIKWIALIAAGLGSLAFLCRQAPRPSCCEIHQQSIGLRYFDVSYCPGRDSPGSRAYSYPSYNARLMPSWTRPMSP
jgi:hypothetical protein